MYKFSNFKINFHNINVLLLVLIILFSINNIDSAFAISFQKIISKSEVKEIDNYFDNNFIIVQDNQLGNRFYNQIPFVDVDSRLPPRDQPEYLRERASGRTEIPGSQELIDPYSPLPSQQPPPILPYDQGVNLPNLKIDSNLGKSTNNVLDQSYLDRKNSVFENNNQGDKQYNKNYNLPPVPKTKEVVLPTYNKGKVNQIPLPPLADEMQQIIIKPASSLAKTLNSSQNRWSSRSIQKGPIEKDYSNQYNYPRADFQGSLPIDFYDLQDDVLDQEISREPENLNLQDKSGKASFVKIDLKSPGYTKDDGRYVLHLASYFNTKDANRGWEILKKSSKNTILGLKKSIVKVNIRGVTYYRLLAGRFAEITHAKKYCSKLNEFKLYCNIMPVAIN